MELNDGNLQALAAYLQKTLTPDPIERRKAEDFLKSVEGSQNYPVLLLHLVDKPDSPMHIRVGAAVTLKNFVKRNWSVAEDEVDKIHANDRAVVKSLIVGLMLKSPEQIQRQLSDAIGFIGRADFPDKWQDLLDEMISKFQCADFHIINGVLFTAHSLFKRYRHEFKSQKLWTEIKFVLDRFAAPLTQLFNSLMELATAHANNKDALKVIFGSLVLICKIFYSLNFQDLPEFFEDNMATWMTHFLTLLTTDNKLLCTDDKEEPGLLEQVKSQICDNVSMYAQKYDEEFGPHLPGFVSAVWGLLINTGPDVKYDLLVSNAIQFLASVAERPGYKQLFEDQSTLTSICEKVIVPNMEFRDADEEAFEDNAEEYIRRDVEGSDTDTRRRAACDLVRALSKSFEAPIITIFSGYVQLMLEEYAKNPNKNWKNKDAAIFLVTSLAAKAQTQKHGITQTSELVNVGDFFHSNIAPDLQSSNINENPVLKADAIKYVMVFRNQLPREVLVAAMSLLVQLLRAESHVVHSYAACCIERILTVKTPQGPLAVTKADIGPYSELLLTNLFIAVNLPGSLENEYIMKAIMRTLSVLQESFVPHIATIINQLTAKLMLVSKNPSKPHFNHYLFESICITITTTCRLKPEAISSFEDGLFPPFQLILQQDVQEFIPYIFQVLAVLLEMQTASVSEPYMALFPHLLQPTLWEKPGNVPPLVRLLQAYINRGMHQIGPDKLPGLLGIFQKLLASKANDNYGFGLMGTLIQRVPGEQLAQFMPQVFILVFQRLQNSKTPKYIRCVLVYFSEYAIKYGASSLIETVDKIQPKLFGMVIEKLFVQDLQKLADKIDAKICAVGVAKILTESPAMLQPDYLKLWPLLLQSLISLFELPRDETVNPDADLTADLDDSAGFQAAYSHLAFAGKLEHDPCPDIVDAKIYLAKCLSTLCTAHPNNIKSMISTGLQPEAVGFLQTYLQTAAVQLV